MTIEDVLSGRATHALIKFDCLEVLRSLPDNSIDLGFADPPYFLSNGGSTCSGGERTSVDKGAWDKSQGLEEDRLFQEKWLELMQQKLKPSGTLVVSGTFHCIFGIGYTMQKLGYHILNNIVWAKNNPPPNMACRYFTHSNETLIWASPGEGKKLLHTFNYQLMKQMNGGKQMKDVWEIPVVPRGEKRFGGHPTQKPERLLERVILAASNPGDLVVDPFCGAGTTGVAAVRHGRRFLGIDLDADVDEQGRKSDYIGTAQRRIDDAVARRSLDRMVAANDATFSVAQKNVVG